MPYVRPRYSFFLPSECRRTSYLGAPGEVASTFILANFTVRANGRQPLHGASGSLIEKGVWAHGSFRGSVPNLVTVWLEDCISAV